MPHRLPLPSARNAACAAGLVALVVALGAASPASAAPRPGARAQAPSLEEGRRLLREATGARGDAARELASEALAHLAILASRETATCEVVVLAVEAALRAGQLEPVPPLIGAAHSSGCDPAAVQQLTGWFLEFNEDGVRRGPGAPLAQAQAAYRDAADLLLQGPSPRPDLALGALASAAALAHERRAWTDCAALIDQAIDLETDPERRAELGARRVACRSPEIGEGSALDELTGILSEGEIVAAARLRQRLVQSVLRAGRTDPVALAAHATYALFAPTPQRVEIAHRDLLDALALDDELPEAWYVLGRVHAERGRLDEAATAHRRQLALDPGGALPATRLAVNDLANALVQTGAPAEELRSALQRLDAEIARTPDEAALHETRSSVLSALGRDEEAEAAARRAAELDPTLG